MSDDRAYARTAVEQDMAKEKTVAASSSALSLFVSELFQFGIYKKTQGRMARQLTALAIWAFFLVSFYKLVAAGVPLFGAGTPYKTYILYGIPGLFLAAGVWFGYRLVNYPPFADFLIAVEAEMNKVSWPSQREIVRSSVVVIVMMLGLMVVVYGFDLLISFILQLPFINVR
ncbi:MAG: preprotein translocase subunit SecE [Planctomycetaceae bacterium]